LLQVEFGFSGPVGGEACETVFRYLISVSYEQLGIGGWFALSGRRRRHYTVGGPFLRDLSPGGRVLFLSLYSSPLAFVTSFKTIL
jgi:hypothetical protein